jgi:hypothetical protein
MHQQSQAPSARGRAAVQPLLTQEFIAAHPIHVRRRPALVRFRAEIYRPFFRLLERARSMLRGCTERSNFLSTISARSFARKPLSAARC